MRVKIEPKGEKGRAFHAELVAWAKADFWTDGDKATRPVWAVFAGPAEQLRAFVANLLEGGVAKEDKGWQKGGERFEFMRSAGYMVTTRTLEDGSAVATFALRWALTWECPAEPARALSFVVLPPLAWVAEQRFDETRAIGLLRRLEADTVIRDQFMEDEWRGSVRTRQSQIRIDKVIESELHRMLAYGALLLHYLDHRLALPIPRDPVFGAWLLLLGHVAGPIKIAGRPVPGDTWGSNQRWYKVEDAEAAGASPGFLFHAGGFDVPAWLAREVQRFMRAGGM